MEEFDNGEIKKNDSDELDDTINEEIDDTIFEEEPVVYDIEETYSGVAKHFNPEKRTAKVLSDKEYIKTRLIDQRDYFDKKAKLNQSRYKKIKTWEFILAASIPVLVSFSALGLFEDTVIISKTVIENGIKVKDPVFTVSTILQIVAAVAGIFLAFFNKKLELEEYYKNWKEYRYMNEALEQERMLYVTRCEPYDEANAYPLLVEKIESTLSKQVQKWRQVPKSQSSDLVKKAQDSLNKQSEKIMSGGSKKSQSSASVG